MRHGIRRVVIGRHDVGVTLAPQTSGMRVLLVQAACPPTYWGYKHSLPFLDKDAPLPPLGLATLAAHLPEQWELKLHDLHLGPLPEETLRWADAVMVSGMLVQAPAMREVLHRAKELGKPTVVGGPAPTTSPAEFPEATYLFQGEAEGRLDLLFTALESPGTVKERVLSPSGERPSLSLSRIPRFDLLRLDRYASMSIQVSRGCPFNCEFCDIIEMFGRVPRLKTGAQVLAELDALRRLGVRGSLFFVDDNFIGNRKAVAKLLPQIAAWQRAHGQPFDLYTEASLDLAGDTKLTKAMVEAGFSSVFVRSRDPRPGDPQEDPEAAEPADGPGRGGSDPLPSRARGVCRLHRGVRRRRPRRAPAPVRVRLGASHPSRHGRDADRPPGHPAMAPAGA